VLRAERPRDADGARARGGLTHGHDARIVQCARTHARTHAQTIRLLTRAHSSAGAPADDGPDVPTGFKFAEALQDLPEARRSGIASLQPAAGSLRGR
jgi:hypothetical protein